MYKQIFKTRECALFICSTYDTASFIKEQFIDETGNPFLWSFPRTLDIYTSWQVLGCVRLWSCCYWYLFLTLGLSWLGIEPWSPDARRQLYQLRHREGKKNYHCFKKNSTVFWNEFPEGGRGRGERKNEWMHDMAFRWDWYTFYKWHIFCLITEWWDCYYLFIRSRKIKNYLWECS